MRASLVAMLVLAAAAPARAQAPGQTPPVGAPRTVPPPPGPPRAGRPSRIERLKQRIREKRSLDLADALGLDEKTAARMFAVLAHYDEQFDRLLAARADMQRALNAADQIADPRALQQLIDQAVANKRALWDAEEHRLVDLRAILTPQQTARLLVALPALERKLQNQLQKAVARPRANQEPGDVARPRGNPGPRDDDP